MLVQKIQDFICEFMFEWKVKYFGVEDMQVVVMGCVVNGFGESKYVNIGILLFGIGEDFCVLVYQDGKLLMMLKGLCIVEEFQELLEKYVEECYG